LISLSHGLPLKSGDFRGMAIQLESETGIFCPRIAQGLSEQRLQILAEIK
jgi:hypothetical protein